MSNLARQLIARLDNPVLWRTSRSLLNLAFGLYRRRFRVLRDWGVLAGRPSVLDVGCGIGQYASITDGPYLGVDLNERYVAHAARRYRGTNRTFRCVDVTVLWRENKTFDLVLMVDFLHHLCDADAVAILREAARLSAGHVVNFEPVKRQTNPVGQWIIDHDRGHYIRPLDDLHGLYERAGLSVRRSDPLYLGPILTRAVLCGKEVAAPPEALSRAG
jgi:SAM-dependent methyltransferase